MDSPGRRTKGNRKCVSFKTGRRGKKRCAKFVLT